MEPAIPERMFPLLQILPRFAPPYNRCHSMVIVVLRASIVTRCLLVGVITVSFVEAHIFSCCALSTRPPCHNSLRHLSFLLSAVSSSCLLLNVPSFHSLLYLVVRCTTALSSHRHHSRPGLDPLDLDIEYTIYSARHSAVSVV